MAVLPMCELTGMLNMLYKKTINMADFSASMVFRKKVLASLVALFSSFMSIDAMSQAISDTATETANQADKAVNSNENEIEEVRVIYKRQNLMTVITEDAEKLTRMPGALGDPLQAAFALPGVVAAGGSADALSVRGSSPDDNLFEVDFMPAGYIFHNFGNSIFNRHIIQDFKLYSAAYGSSYSNATGAVFDVTLRNPKNQRIRSTIDFSLFNSGVFFEGGITENTAFYLAGRKSMLPFFFSEGEEIKDDGEPSGVTIDSSPDDNDFQGKLQWTPSDSHQITYAFTGANDKGAASFTESSELALLHPEFMGSLMYSQGFTSQSLLWDYFGEDWTIKSGVGYLTNDEKLEIGQNSSNPEGFFQNVVLDQATFKTRAQYTLSDRQQWLIDAAYYDAEWKLSYDSFYNNCTPETEPDCDTDLGERFKNDEIVATPNGFIGVSHLWSINHHWESELGGQWQYNDYTGEHFVLPRLALRYHVSNNSSVLAKYGHYNRQQTVDILSPTLGNPRINSQTSQHAALTFEQSLANDWQWSVETYYKTLSDLPLAVDSSSLVGDQESVNYTNETSGRAYGAELLINKNQTDRWYGWLSLSYAKSERTNDRTNTTLDYFADTPLVVNGVWGYDLSERWNMGINLTVRSGQAYTPIIGMQERSDFSNRYVPIFGETNSERFELSKRLDVRFERKGQWFGKDTMFIVEVMNVLNQKNIQAIRLDYDEIDKTNAFALEEDEDAFGIRPSIGFSITL